MAEPTGTPDALNVATPTDGKVTQPGPDFMAEIRERFDRAYTAEQSNRKEMVEDLRFRAGEQWPSDVAGERQEAGRPILTINQMPQFVKQVTGDVRINNPSIKVRPVDDEGDPEIAEIYQGMIRDIEQKSQSSVVYATGADNQVTAGMGWWRVITQYAGDDTFDQEIRLERIRSSLSVYTDPKAARLDKSDAQWLYFCEWMELEDFETAYPDAAVVSFTTPNSEQQTLQNWTRPNQVRVAEYWKKVPVRYTLGQLDTGETVNLSKAGARAEIEAAGRTIERERRVETYEIRMWKVSGVEILEHGEKGALWAGRFLPFVCATGEEVFVDERTVIHGLVRFAKDPQRLYNYWRSASAEVIALAPKAPYLATPEQLKGHTNQWNSANIKNHPYLLYNPDPKAPAAMPTRQTLRDVPIEMFQEAQFASADMNATTGIYPPSLGQRSSETSGIAISRREQQGDVGTFIYIDNLSQAIEHTGRILVDLIPRIYDADRVVRLLNEDGETYEAVKINEATGEINPVTGEPVLKNDLSVGKYDVRVSTGPSFTTRRQEAAASMMEFVQAVPGSAPAIADLIAKNLDWPGGDEIAARLRRIAEQGGVVEPEETPEGEEPEAPKEPSSAEMMQMRAMMAQIQKTESETAENLASAQKSNADAQETQVKAASEALDMFMTGPMPDMIAAAVQDALTALAQTEPQTQPGPEQLLPGNGVPGGQQGPVA